MREIYSVNEGSPPEINLTNEKNNGQSILNLINLNLVESCHDVSSGGILISLAEMSMASMLGLKITRPKKFNDLNEYFFAEDQSRYLIEIERDNLDKVKSNHNHEGDPTGNSKVKQIVYWHKSGSVFIECINWSEKITKEKNWGDNLSVGVAVSEYDTWLNTKAY